MSAEIPGLPLADRGRESENKLPSAVEYDARRNMVRILDIKLPCRAERSPKAPSKNEFKYFARDRRTMETVRFTGTAVHENSPCLLEGVTATSKTSSIFYLASELGYEVETMNCNGQTDTSDLIGKYVPNDGEMQIRFEQLLKNQDVLSQASREILEKIEAETPKRSLTKVEAQKIATNEGFDIPEWKWVDGALIRAMKEGKWLLLDEINLAETQILERLNTVLGIPPRITVAEKDGETIGPEGDFEVHPDFRIFATMNPSTYEGRNPLSPAFRNRWGSQMEVAEPTVEEYKGMINLMVTGKHPDIILEDLDGGEDMEFSGDVVDPMFEKLSNIEGIDLFVEKFSSFYSQLLVKCKDRKELGKDKQEEYIFTRRDIINFLRKLEAMEFYVIKPGVEKKVNLMVDPKAVILRSLRESFMMKMASEDDKNILETLLNVIGMTASNWTLDLKAKIPPKKSIFEILAAGEIPDEVECLDGNIVHLSEKKSMYGYNTKDLIRVKGGDDDESVLEEIRLAEELRVAGFTNTGEIVLALEGIEFVLFTKDEFDKKFEVVKTFLEYDPITGKADLEVSPMENVKEHENVRVGDKYRLKEFDPDKVLDIETVDSVYEVVGFKSTDGGNVGKVMLQIDGGPVKPMRLKAINKNFDLIEQDPDPYREEWKDLATEGSDLMGNLFG